MTKKDCITKDVKKQRVTDTLSFVAVSSEVHDNKYTYEKTIYVRTSEKVEVTCKIHGSFWQVAKNHLIGKGCPNCKYIRREDGAGFIAESSKKHQGQYSYELVDYINATTKVVITCKKHGAFLQKPYLHLKGRGCKECGLVKTISSTVGSTKDFILKAKEVHLGRYTYENVEYKNNRKKVSITCLQHGDFLQKPNDHLSKKQGCPKCRPKGWLRSGFIDACNNNGGYGSLYVIKCTSDNESFFKVGITSYPIHTRFSGVVRMPYDYEIVSKIDGDGGFVYDLEKKISRLLYDYDYTPAAYFSGHTECFTKITKPVEKLLKQLESTAQLPLIA